MRYSTTVLATALVAAAPSLQAAVTYGGKAIVVNQCDYDLHLWSVDNYFKSEMYTISPGQNYTEPLRIPDSSCDCGVSLKVSKGKSINKPIVQFEYTISPGADTSRFVSYDVSFVDCSTSEPSIAAIDGYSYFSGADCPAWDKGISVTGSSSECPTMSCAPGSFCYEAAYFEPEPAKLLNVQPVRQCPNGDLTSDVIFTACTSNDGSSSGDDDDSSSSALVSSSTPTPTPSSSSSSSSSSSPTPSSSSAAQSSSSSDVSAAEFAPVDVSVASPTPVVTQAAVLTEAAVYTAFVYETIYTTEWVDTSGDRVNEDGSKYFGRRFAA